MINFVNGLATLKDSNTVIDEAVLRQTKVYGKLMMSKGIKFGEVTDRSQFLLSDSGDFIRAELFIIGKNGTIVTDNRLFLNVAIDSDIGIDEVNKCYVVELIHPRFDPSKLVKADF